MYKEHYLFPSSLYASIRPSKVLTILGSCVAVCLWDPVLRIGGINHYMLPLWNGIGLASPKYGNIAIEKLVKKLESLGSDRKNLKAKLFGGGEMLGESVGQFDIGARNIQVAHDLLKEYNIPIVSASTGGQLGRKIFFLTDEGKVIHRFIKKQNESYDISKQNKSIGR